MEIHELKLLMDYFDELSDFKTICSCFAFDIELKAENKPNKDWGHYKCIEPLNSERDLHGRTLHRVGTLDVALSCMDIRNHMDFFNYATPLYIRDLRGKILKPLLLLAEIFHYDCLSPYINVISDWRTLANSERNNKTTFFAIWDLIIANNLHHKLLKKVKVEPCTTDKIPSNGYQFLYMLTIYPSIAIKMIEENRQNVIDQYKNHLHL